MICKFKKNTTCRKWTLLIVIMGFILIAPVECWCLHMHKSQAVVSMCCTTSGKNILGDHPFHFFLLRPQLTDSSICFLFCCILVEITLFSTWKRNERWATHMRAKNTPAKYCFRKGTKWNVTNVNKWRQREANEIKKECKHQLELMKRH